MEFKYMLVGNAFYGDEKKFHAGANNFLAEVEDETTALKRKSTLTKDTDETKKEKWHCANYDAAVKDRNNPHIGKKI
jgi:hypothetical protein